MGEEFIEDSRQPGKVAAVRGENFQPETERAKPGFHLRQLNWIGVEAEQSSARREPWEDFLAWPP